MSDNRTIAALDALRSRLDVVRTVREEPRRKPDLSDRLNVSRSTVDRAVRELRSAGLLVRDDGEYVLTLYGELLADCYEAFLADAREVGAAGPLLEALPADAPMAREFLAGATVETADPPATHRPVSRFERLLAEADRMRGLSRTISQSTTPRLINERVRDGMTGELVVGADLAAHVRSDPHERSRERENVETGRYRLFEVDSIPYGLALLDLDDGTRAVVFVYDDDNDLLGTITADDPEAVAWAETLYERYRSRATDISSTLVD
ncbi:helix-turn-helix transcriptional regulator [Salinilacihabitans rarus]|uniref:helix-turn-helix transcriptional regulator n=1 Tax=Salinilacihabitans rarus TaxID=2961596 RepID=UPI0020C84236|nr:HTH domain-containing protein [Salinilacihabitans rarus]